MESEGIVVVLDVRQVALEIVGTWALSLQFFYSSRCLRCTLEL